MKKTFLIIAGIIAFIVLSLATVPFLFKDKIKAKIDSELARTVNANILYDVDKFSLSIFRNFPNLTISIDDFGIIGKQEEFKGDTLFYAKSFRAVADVMSVIRGEKITVKGIKLVKPKIVTMVAKNGKSSWDLMIASPEDSVKNDTQEPSEFSVGIDNWEIEDGLIVYNDATLPMYAELRHVNHKGKGDITQEIVDIETITKSPEVIITYDGIHYLNKHSFEGDMKMNMNYAKGEYKFLQNEFKINDFKFGFDGMVAMIGEDIKMDVTFKGHETEFKNLISLVPAVFMKDYEKIETEGKVAFSGFAKGVMNEKSMPTYGVNLKVSEGMLHYPDLPNSIKNIVADINLENKDGIADNIIVDVKKFHMDMGANPIDATLLMEGLSPSHIDANVIAKVNLGDITKMYPIEGTTLKGVYNLDLKAKGIYSETQWPIINAAMGLSDGYVKTKDFPEPIENLSFNAIVTNTSAALSTVKINLLNFAMKLQGEPFQMKALVENLDDPKYDVIAKGVIDLTKLTKIYPLEDMKVAGRINADIQTKGVMSDVQAGKYGNTSTSGTMDITNLAYTSKDLPQGMTLSSASFNFTPEKININSMKGNIGKSDMDVKGYFSNYMGYLFGKQDTIIRGNMVFASNKFDVNEWMADETAQPVSGQEQPMEVFEVPKNIDFFLASNINTVLYDNMTLKDMTGNIIMKDGIVKMDKLVFNTLGGNFVTSGTYNTQDINHPKFNLDLNIKEMSIKEAYNTFNTVKTLAPAAKDITGAVTTNLVLDGELGKDMMPVYKTLTGGGLAQILSAQIVGNSVLKGLSSVTKLNTFDPMALKNVLMKFKIQDGKVLVEPFDLDASGVKMNISGANGMDGGIDYLVKMDLPAGAIGASANGAIAQLTGKTSATPQNVKLDFKVGGTYNNPKISLVSSSMKEQAKDAVKEIVTNKVKEELIKNESVQKAQLEADRLKKETEDRVRAEQERLKAEQLRLQKEAEDKAKKEAENVIKDKIKNKLPKF